jgi:hypothetical protein
VQASRLILQFPLLSNAHSNYPVILQFNCCEQYMMSNKAKHFGDKEAYQKVSLDQPFTTFDASRSNQLI